QRRQGVLSHGVAPRRISEDVSHGRRRSPRGSSPRADLSRGHQTHPLKLPHPGRTDQMAGNRLLKDQENQQNLRESGSAATISVARWIEFRESGRWPLVLPADNKDTLESLPTSADPCGLIWCSSKRISRRP